MMHDRLEITAPEPHSISRHPLAEVLDEAEWAKIKRQVQYAEISWPVGVETETLTPEGTP